MSFPTITITATTQATAAPCYKVGIGISAAMRAPLITFIGIEPASETIIGSLAAQHPLTFNMACCDGAVHSLSYDIDPATYAKLGGRNDKGVIDSSKVTW